ncbi:MAG: amino acid permease [Pseudomonadota bacterium]
MSEKTTSEPTNLARVLSLPMLVFYGLGVTIGAGIFALIGEVVRLAGDQAPLSFLAAGITAGLTGVSYALLVRIFPRAGGEAVFVHNGLGPLPARLAGYGIVVTAIISSAAISLAFGGYVASLTAWPVTPLAIAVIIFLAAIAGYGVMLSVSFAAAITILELGLLVVVAFLGTPALLSPETQIAPSFAPNPGALSGILGGALLAFFAFIGFEDIENMAEETRDPVYVLPRAIFWTLGITITIYVAIALVAVHAVDRTSLLNSSAPMATVFESVTGLDGRPVAAIAAFAMINGILVQMLMAARVLYGMAREGLAPAWLGAVSENRKTPARATWIVALSVTAFAALFPLAGLAATTSFVTLSIFTLVNVSLFTIGRRHDDKLTRRLAPLGLVAAAVCIALMGWNLIVNITIVH